MTSRRTFVRQGLLSAAGATLPPHALRLSGIVPGVSATYVELRREPDSVTIQTDSDYRELRLSGRGRWESGRMAVTCMPIPDALHVSLAAPADAVRRIHLRWRGRLAQVRLMLGDAWERAYGDLEWRGHAPDRVMPWYFVAWDGASTHGYGVRTGAGALCYWQADPDGISLWADVRSGSAGVRLGDRELAVCDVIARRGTPQESAFTSLRRLCALLCPSPRLPAEPVYGHNDWYYAYGNNSATSVIADAQRIVDLSPTGENRPFVVIDDGWQPERGADKLGTGRWDRGNERFPDMPGLAGQIRTAGARAGIWMRPLLAPADAPDSWRLSRLHTVLDPTIGSVAEKVAADVGRMRQWGFELIKHDYSTFDIMGRWGSQMGSSLTRDGWTFADGPVRTTAEVIGEFYRTIRTAAGDALVIGCNTVSHLSAGLFELCRIGDDTSGAEWERVPKMGVNALAFRGAQQGAFYVADPDCVGVTKAIPWQQNRQWLDLLAHSGTTLFVSLAPDAVGEAERRDLQVALALASGPESLAEPVDGQRTMWPAVWHTSAGERRYDWTGPGGLPAAG